MAEDQPVSFPPADVGLSFQGAGRVLLEVRKAGAATRGQLVSATGLSLAAVDRIVRDQIAANRLRIEMRMRTGRAGPESELIAINPDAGRLIGIDIGSTSIKTQVLDFAFRPVAALQPRPTPTDEASLIRTVRQVTHELVSGIGRDQSDAPLLGLGFAWPGAVDPVRRIARFGPNIQYYSDLSLDDVLSSETFELLRGVPVAVDHDTECVAIAEQMVGGPDGRMRPERNLSCFLVGTGVAAGMIVNGQLVRGAGNFAGELGHVMVNPEGTWPCGCKRLGCLEQEVSGPAIERKARALGHWGPDVTTEQLERYALENDARAVAFYEEIGRWMGKGLAILVNILNPELIVVTGGVTAAYELFYPSLRQSLSESCWQFSLDNLRIVATRLGTNVTAFGAAIMAYLESENRDLTFRGS